MTKICITENIINALYEVKQAVADHPSVRRVCSVEYAENNLCEYIVTCIMTDGKTVHQCKVEHYTTPKVVAWL